MKNEIILKLNRQLASGIQDEAVVVYALTLIRKLSEVVHATKTYPVLRFYADWAGYKLGYYAPIGECFKPHFDTINIGGLHHVTASRPNSKVLFQEGSDRSFYETQIRKEIAVQKWDATMDLIAAARKKIFGAATSLENPSP